MRQSIGSVWPSARGKNSAGCKRAQANFDCLRYDYRFHSIWVGEFGTGSILSGKTIPPLQSAKRQGWGKMAPVLPPLPVVPY